MDQPISGERWVGAEGCATTFNGSAARVRRCEAISDATAFATFPEQFKGEDAERFRRLYDSAKLVRYGTDCYGCGMLAIGFADLWIEAGLKLYDFAALVPIVQGAGGVMTDWMGRPLGRESDGRVLAAGDAELHRRVIGLLAA